MSNKKATGKKVQSEQSIHSKIKEIVHTDAKAYYIIWKYAPLLLPNREVETFEDLRTTYKCFTPAMSESFCENWLIEENVQTAVKFLLSRLHQQKMIALYEKFYSEALNGDVQAFKALQDFSEKFFKNEDEAEIQKILHNADLNSDDEIHNE